MMADYWDECFNPGNGVSPTDFEKTFCHVCRNAECTRSSISSSAWVRRMATQVDRLFTNAKFADADDPRFSQIRGLDFQPGRGRSIEVPVRQRPGGGDWDDPRQPPPQAFVAPKVETAPAPTPKVEIPPRPGPKAEPPPEILREVHVRGSGETYRVTLKRAVGADATEWDCECRAFRFGTSRPCKHILYASSLPADEVPEPTVQATSRPEPVRSPIGVPRVNNIPVPAGGVMVDGSAPPKPNNPREIDPWDSPKRPNDTVVPVHGRVVMGKKER